MEERKTNKHRLGLALSIRMEKFCILCICGSNEHVPEWNSQIPGMLTHPLVLADLASGSTSPNSLLQQLPLSNRRISLTVSNSYLLTALGPCLSLFSSGAKTDQEILWLALTNTYRMNSHHHTTSCCWYTLVMMIWFNTILVSLFLKKKFTIYL